MYVCMYQSNLVRRLIVVKAINFSLPKAKFAVAIVAIEKSQIRLSDVKLKHRFRFQQQTFFKHQLEINKLL